MENCDEIIVLEWVLLGACRIGLKKMNEKKKGMATRRGHDKFFCLEENFRIFLRFIQFFVCLKKRK